MTPDIQTIFFDVGNTLRIVVPDQEFIDKAEAGLMELIQTKESHDELFAKLAHKGERHRCVVDESTTLAVGVHLATQQTLLRLVVEIVVLEEVFQHVGVVDTKVECGFYDALVATALHLLRIGAVAKQQSDGADDDTLACAGFARNDGEAWVERHLKMVDEREVAYVEFF